MTINEVEIRNKVIHKLRTAYGFTLQEIGNLYDLTRERVRQICNGAPRGGQTDLPIEEAAIKIQRDEYRKMKEALEKLLA